MSMTICNIRASMLGAMTIVALWLGAGTAVAQVSAATCGSLSASFGPFDYRPDFYNPGPDRVPYQSRLSLVEGAHFTPPVELLIRGATTTLPGGDIEYTLRAWPNHHRALAAVTRMWERSRLPTPPGMSRPSECYFERALRFQPTDTTARLLYVNFLLKGSRKKEATDQLEIAIAFAKDNPFTHNNIGLLYMDAGMPEQALQQAHRAIALGLARRDLIDRLSAAGHWREPQAAASSEAASSATKIDTAPDPSTTTPTGALDRQP